MALHHFNNRRSADVGLTEPTGTFSPNSANIYDDRISHAPDKYRGTSADERDMTAMGKKQVLRVGGLLRLVRSRC